jgi:hypothetical protein
VSDEEPRAKDVIDAAANPELLARLEAWAHGVRPFTAAIAPYMREQRLRLEAKGWRYEGQLQIEEREIPYELTRDLTERMPQAKLRDLYRPEMQVGWHEREQVVPPFDTAGIRAMAEAKAQRHFEKPETLAALTALVRDEQRRRAAWLREPWQPFLRDDEPRKALVAWGGTHGGLG